MRRYDGTRYALIELGFELQGDLSQVIGAVRAAGRRPIVSHPERYRRGRGTVLLAEIRAWKRAGALADRVTLPLRRSRPRAA